VIAFLSPVPAIGDQFIKPFEVIKATVAPLCVPPSSSAKDVKKVQGYVHK
jgi:hypothetical protein